MNLYFFLVLSGAFELFYHIPETHLIVRVHLICAFLANLLLGFHSSHCQHAVVILIGAATAHMIIFRTFPHQHLQLRLGLAVLRRGRGDSHGSSPLEPLTRAWFCHVLLGLRAAGFARACTASDFVEPYRYA